MSTRRMFTFSERVGQLFTVIGAAMSIASATFVLSFATYRWARKRFGRVQAISLEATDSSLFLNLMLSDLFQATGEMPTVRWFADGYITDGKLCKFQSGMRHFGAMGVAFSSLFIGIYTFWVLVLRRVPASYAPKLGCLIIWIFSALLVMVPNLYHNARGEVFYGPSGFWCWIRYEWKSEQAMTSYFWLWFCAFGMLILYTIIFLSIRGYLKTPRNRFLSSISMASTVRSEVSAEEPDYTRTKAVATSMLYFPLVYIITIGPNSITRWIEFSGHHVPAQATLFSNTMFRLSGFFNFVLFVTTRPRMALGDNVISPKPPIIIHRSGQQIDRPANPLVHFVTPPKDDDLEDNTYSNDKAQVDVELSPIDSRGAKAI